MSERIQLRRTRGWRKPEGAIVVSRPSRWGNPFTIAGAIDVGWADNEDDARKFAVECFQDWLLKGILSDWWFHYGKDRHEWMREHVRDLRGGDLACWCRLDQPCHADVLLEIANVL
jgi:hypothetical protein